MNPPPAIVWFLDDLRLADNPALSAAAKSGAPLIAVYILDDETKGVRPLGGAARWWLAGSLRALGEALEKLDLPLVLRSGPAKKVLDAIVKETGAKNIFWNRRYGHAAEADAAIENALKAIGVEVHSFNANLLHKPGTVLNKAGQPMRVFTPFWRALQEQGLPRPPLPAPKKLNAAKRLKSEKLGDWKLEPTKPDWAGGLRDTWTVGEKAARKRLADFVDDDLSGYTNTRDRPDLDITSKLSPYLRFGEVSPFQVWHAAKAAQESRSVPGRDVEKFLSEVAWREFSYHLLHHWPDLGTKNFEPRFNKFPWREDRKALRAWQKGQTGYPLVDAGMRQLWHTGFIHNRVRMVCASFLTKHLLLDWRLGEQWFWDTLVDADPANNTASWQWVAGSGADAAPYFRIFNPALQAAKFDPKGEYITRWVPELAGRKPADIHEPPAGLFSGYLQPVVDHAAARERALKAFEKTRNG